MVPCFTSSMGLFTIRNSVHCLTLLLKDGLHEAGLVPCSQLPTQSLPYCLAQSRCSVNMLSICYKGKNKIKKKTKNIREVGKTLRAYC